MDTTYCLYYGLMCLVNGIFDSILCTERWIHVKYSIFSRAAPLMFNVASAIFLLCPMVELASAVLAAYIYTDAQDAESSRLLFSNVGTVADVEAATRAHRGQPPDQAFLPFQ